MAMGAVQRGGNEPHRKHIFVVTYAKLIVSQSLIRREIQITYFLKNYTPKISNNTLAQKWDV
jgi:hypothetical protein